VKVTHLQSASQITSLGNTRILTDPWLTAGEYYGSWYHYPPFGEDDLVSLEYDYIYISHIHPDHLSEDTFKKLPHKKPVLIHNYDSKFLKRKLEMLGYEVIECDHGKPFEFEGGGSITIYAADNCDPALCSKFLGCAIVEKKFGSTQIDTLALFQHDGHSVINTNDCPFELSEATIKSNGLDKIGVDLLLVGYGGAGPYPQCFEFDTVDQKREAARAKERQFLEQAIKYIELLKPKAFAPFAGTYILGSRLAPLTEFRGVPSLQKALDYLNGKLDGLSVGLLLEQFDVYDVVKKELRKNEQRFDPSYADYVAEISKFKLAYDDDSWDDLEIPELIEAAYKRFKSKAEEIGFSSKTRIAVQSDKVAYVLSTQSEPIQLSVGEEMDEPFVRISVDHNLLHRLLRGPRYAHWNNAEIGSHLRYERRPNVYERGLYYCMCFLHR
jgi:UDP-MurNAc hydroxylase